MAELTTTERAVWSTASANDLPDSAFAYIEPGGKKDEEGKTTPRSLRHLPYKNADGKVDPAHVRNALARLSQTQIPDSAKASARAKLVAAAKSVGIEVSDDNKERSMQTSTHTHDTLTRAANHEPMTGKHSHAHPAMGSQGDDDGHDHEHSHDGDNSHDHDHAERAAASQSIAMYAPITRIDTDEWVIEGQATSDALDHYGTIFDYESSKKAFQTWRGNIREMHKNEAVGRAIEVTPDDDNRCIFLRAKISKGARNTWEKILDGTLSGFSIGVPPNRYKTRSVVRNGKTVPEYYDHELAEVSVVDNPGSPNCDIAIVRADGFATDVLDTSEETTAVPESLVSSSPALSRAGARVSGDTRSAMHDSIGHTLKAAVSQMKNCNCDGCQSAMKMLDPDNDGDIDLGGFMDTDNDADQLYGGSGGDMERDITGIVERILTQQLSAVYTRLQGIAGTLARSQSATSKTTLNTLISGTIERALVAANEANASSLSEVRADLSAVKATVDRIDNTPMPGAPIQNASSLPRPVEKRLATEPAQTAPRGAMYEAMSAQFARNATTGRYRTLDEQVDDMAAVLAVQPPIRR